ncbi:integrase core domain-containing protein [Anatilimnocola sp. NA78]|uniref:integrase core domain-containing protein n=1 Tax=Anatilimnocola sp. NA78 TaxID=3415683 RepID=UPI003CE53815
MVNIFQSLMLVIAGATQKELARQVKYLKVENQILRSRLPQRIVCTPKERVRLIKFAQKLGGKVLRQLTTIVAPETLLGWIRAEKKPKPQKRKRGRPNTPEQIRQLILLMAKENQWGYTRIMGELKKLGIKPPSRNTVKKILKAAGFEPGPRRGEGTWDDFLQQHAVSLWQCDFFSKRILTMKGIREVFVLAYIHVASRRVILSPATFHPDEAWVQAQAESFVKLANQQGMKPAILQRNRDSKFTKSFDRVLKRKRVKVKVGAFRAPNTNAFVERFVQSIQQECLDRFVIFGEKHMNHVCKEYLEYYHRERPHQGVDNELVIKPMTRNAMTPAQSISVSEILCSDRLGGLLKSYLRKAA